MPVVPKFSEERLPRTIKDIFHQARAGKIDANAFLDAMEAHQINGIQKLLYACKAFSLSLETVKQIEVSRGRGIADEDAEDIIAVLGQLNHEE